MDTNIIQHHFVICIVKYTHLCIRHGVQTSCPLFGLWGTPHNGVCLKTCSFLNSIITHIVVALVMIETLDEQSNTKQRH
jgi:hypothetical protein